MPKSPNPIDPHLTQIAVAYRNPAMIADQVLPRVVVGKEEFKYWKYTMEDGFTVPDSKVGRTSKPNQVEFGSTQVTDSTQDYGLDDPIPQKDIDNAPDGYDVRGRAVEGITNLIELGREVRAANLVFNATNYATSNKTQLSGTSQFSDAANSDPIGLIEDSLESMVMRANIGVMGGRAASILLRHPDILKGFHGNSGDKGKATLTYLAELFGLDAIYVGRANVNTSKKGQTPVLQRAWGNHIAFMYRDMTADIRGGVTFGMTAQFGGRVSSGIPDPDIGLKGGERVRVGESVKELLTANDLGFFIEDAVA